MIRAGLRHRQLARAMAAAKDPAEKERQEPEGKAAEEPQEEKSKKSAFEEEDEEAEDQEEILTEEQMRRKRIRGMIFRTVFYSALGWFGYNYYLFREKSVSARYDTFYNQYLYNYAGALDGFFQTCTDYVVSPPCKKILGREVLLPGMPRRKTLVLHLDDLLIHKEVKLGKQAEIALRPGLRKFLADVSRMYEVVILSDSNSDYVQQILMTLDSFQKYQLKGFGHEFYRFSSNGFFKDLSILGRADHNIVAIDLEKSRVLAPHQENCIILPKFTGSADDDSLTKLTPLLIHLSQPKVKDVRKELEKLGADPVDAFRAKIMEKVQKHQPAKRKFFQPTTN